MKVSFNFTHWSTQFVCILCTLVLGCSHVPQSEDSSDEANSTTVGSGFVPAPGDLSAKRLFARAYEHYLRGDFPKAILQIESSLILDPDNEDDWIRYLLFYCYMATGEYEKALALSEKLLRDNPYESLAFLQVGLAQMWLGRTNAALHNFNQTLEFESHLASGNFYAGVAYGKLGQTGERNKAFERAEKEYREILNANPNDIRANYELASMLLYWNRSLAQIPVLTKAAKIALETNPDDAILEQKRLFTDYYLPVLEGIWLSRKGEASSSNQILLKAMGKAPNGIKGDLAEIYYYLGVNYSALDDDARARAFLEKALDTDPKGIYSNDIKKEIEQISSIP